MSLTVLKLSMSTNRAATCPLAARAAREHLLHAVEDQRPVRQARERVVGRQEPELLLAARELFVGSLALGVEALGHPHEAELERSAEATFSAWESASGEALSSIGALAQHLGHRVAPPHAAFRQLVQRRRAVGRQLAVDDPRFPAGLDRGLDTLAAEPSGDSAIVELLLMRSKRSLTIGVDVVVPRPRLRAFVSSSTSAARAFSAPPSGQILPEIGHGRRRRGQSGRWELLLRMWIADSRPSTFPRRSGPAT